MRNLEIMILMIVCCDTFEKWAGGWECCGLQMQSGDMSGYGSGYGDPAAAGYQDPSAVTGYGAPTGEARFVLHYRVAGYPFSY